MSEMPEVPRNEKGARDPAHVQNVMMRMGKPFVERLDVLCQANGRSRREIVEILITEAAIELRDDPSARIEPL